MKPASSQAKRRTLFASIAVIIVILTVAAIPTIVRNVTTEKDTQDFAPIYHAAQAMLEGRNIYSATSGLYIYPPFLAFLFQPLALLPEHTAAIVWVITSAFLIVAGALIAAQEVTKRWMPSDQRHWSSTWLIVAAGILLAAEKIHADFRLGQTDCLMILGFACVLRWMTRKPWLAGLAVGATANMKYLSLIFLPYFIIKRNIRATVASILSFAVLMILPALEVGIDEATRFAASAIGALIKMTDLRPGLAGHGMKIPRASWPRSVSITSAVIRFSRAHSFPDWLPVVFILFALAAVIAAVLIISRRHGVPLFGLGHFGPGRAADAAVTLEWACLIVIALTFSPQTTARHMVLLLLVYIVSAGVLLAQQKQRSRYILALAMMITSLGLSFPPRKIGIDEALWAWRGIAGASLCAIFLLLVTLWYGCRTIQTWPAEPENNSNPV